MKKAHIGKIPGLQEFVKEFVSAGGANGYLSKLGLISLPDSERAASAGEAGTMKSIDAASLAG